MGNIILLNSHLTSKPYKYSLVSYAFATQCYFEIAFTCAYMYTNINGHTYATEAYDGFRASVWLKDSIKINLLLAARKTETSLQMTNGRPHNMRWRGKNCGKSQILLQVA